MARWGKTVQQKDAARREVSGRDDELVQLTLQRGATATIAPNAVTNAKLADMAQATIKGRAAGAGTGDPADLTAAQVVAIIATADGAGSGLDADLLDGQSSAAFAAASHAHSAADLTSGVIPDARMPDLTGDVTTSEGAVATTIANNAVTNAKAADMAAWSIKLRNAGTSGDPSDAALADITEEAAPAAGDFLLGFLASGEVRTFDVDNLPSGGGGGFTAATQAEQEAGTDVTVGTTPGRQQFHPSAAKAWVRWHVSTTIGASYNVSSITDSGAGNWTVNINVDMSSATYPGLFLSGHDGTGPVPLVPVTFASTAAGTFNCRSYTPANVLTDPTSPAANANSFVAFGDQA